MDSSGNASSHHCHGDGSEQEHGITLVDSFISFTPSETLLRKSIHSKKEKEFTDFLLRYQRPKSCRDRQK